MLNTDRLGAPGRTRCIKHVGKVIGTRWNWLGRCDSAGIGVEHQPGAAIRKQGRKCRLGQNDGAPASAIMKRIRSAGYEGSSARYVPPALCTASTAIISVGVRGRAIPTTTPGLTPSAASRRAKRAAFSCNVAKVSCSSAAYEGNGIGCPFRLRGAERGKRHFLVALGRSRQSQIHKVGH